MVDIHFSLSDRMRYYWPHPRIRQSVENLVTNLSAIAIPLGLLSQYLPVQFERVMTQQLLATPNNLILDKIQDVLRAYRYGCSLSAA
jgi:D-tagatose-1,6-bisphosphate aldolase subunit GatZ/KbaZ